MIKKIMKDMSNQTETTNVITTNKVEEIIKKDRLGVKLKNNEKLWFDNLFGVRRSGVVFAKTQEEMEEYTKCKLNIHYFSEQYCKIKLEDGKTGKMTLRDYQKDILDLYTNNRYSILMASRQTGKCLTFNTLCDFVDNDNNYFTMSIGELYYRELSKIRKLNIYEKSKMFLYKILKYLK